MPDAVPIALTLPDEQALALALLLKQLPSSFVHGVALNDAEARVMRSAVVALQDALAAAGYPAR